LHNICFHIYIVPVCCVGDPKTDCRSSFELPQLRDWYQPKTALNNVPQGILLKPGSPCDNFLGYCDVFHKCRSVDSNGPLSRLKDLFSPAALESVSQWVQVRFARCTGVLQSRKCFVALLVGCRTYGNWRGALYGVVHQVLCCAYAEQQSVSRYL